MTSSRKLVLTLCLIAVAAALPFLLYYVVRPAFTQTEQITVMHSGPGDELGQDHWFAVLEETKTRELFASTSERDYEVLLVVVLLSGEDEVSYSGGGHGSASSYQFDFLTTREIVGDPWSAEFETETIQEVRGAGDRNRAVVNDKEFALGAVRMILVDEKGEIHPVRWSAIAPSLEAIDERVRQKIAEFRRQRQ